MIHRKYIQHDYATIELSINSAGQTQIRKRYDDPGLQTQHIGLPPEVAVSIARIILRQAKKRGEDV